MWNLLSARSDTNLSKGDRLPSAETLFSAHARILNWWGQAWLGSPHEERLLLKAMVFLPMLVEKTSSEYIFQAMLDQRARPTADQQQTEWAFTLSLSRCCQ